MTTRLITPATELAVTLADAKAHLRIDGDDQDAMVEAWIRGITAHAEHQMGRSILTQTWRCTLDAFPDAIRLDFPPIVSVSSVKYIDEDGAEQTLDPADYIVDTVSEPGYIVPADGVEWPATMARINAVNVEYVAGYGATQAAVPHGIKMYLLAKLMEQYRPNAALKDGIQTSFIESLLHPFKIWSL
ncbi:MAG TPA: phage head-tail connector protein [Noviherbaspirillum sp.]|jgi:uncharacterized phiE125 gp8 family phage protein|uniref:head-tail connector protein n=1 Tax=Noviherbaspirillum sp. TaxID=1926288 RepID=UPI002DDDB844|nr:phage head-tail connector protein [Noviherbaspirillum sp.]HEV2612537.1 phage head-tail connector protein [Noviherbaspirillum sp.]